MAGAGWQWNGVALHTTMWCVAHLQNGTDGGADCPSCPSPEQQQPPPTVSPTMCVCVRVAISVQWTATQANVIWYPALAAHQVNDRWTFGHSVCWSHRTITQTALSLLTHTHTRTEYINFNVMLRLIGAIQLLLFLSELKRMWSLYDLMAICEF